MPVAILTGLAAEARIVQRLGLRAAACGGDAGRAEAALGRLIAEGATALVSFGICGGLDPGLASGTLLLPETVRSEAGERYPVATAWRGALAAGLQEGGIVVAGGTILGASAIAAAPARKAALFRASGAAAVDLESHLVARAALAAALPFIALRAVADPASRALPPAALAPLDGEGRPVLSAVLRSLAQRPAQAPALLRVALDTRRALAALRRAAPALALPLGAAANQDEAGRSGESAGATPSSPLPTGEREG